MDQLCDKCTHLGRKIDDFLAAPDGVDFPSVVLGRRREIHDRSAICCFCALLTGSLHSWSNLLASEDEAKICCLLDEFGNALQITSTQELEDEIRPLYLLPLQKSEKLLSGRLIDTEYVDTDLIFSWINACEAWHQDQCGITPCPIGGRGGGGAPARVIDVAEKRLVDYTPGLQYVTLSYVWGNSNRLTATRAELEHLKTPGVLDQVPRTIADAILLTSLVNEMYLWVDSLCILQDDEVEKRQQINVMDQIYARARFTIVAASGGDADAGLPGILGGSAPRKIEQKIVRISHRTSLIAAQPDFYEVLDKPMGQNKWNSRAWTFQERVLSRRTLIFVDNRVYFACQRVRWIEDVEAQKLPVGLYFQMEGYNIRDELSANNGDQLVTRSHKRDYAFYVKPWPSLTDYRYMVREYSCRYLSREDDVQAAFAGILSRLGPQFAGGFHYGLPEMFFHAALLWQPQQKVRRRRRATPSPAGEFFPSWSWMGWVGAVDPVEWFPEEGYVKDISDDGVRTWLQPTVQYYKSSLDGGRKERILNQGQRHRHYYGNNSATPPKGWHRGVDSDCRQPIYYTHESSPADQFFWPVDILNAQSVAAQSGKPAAEASDLPFLRFKTTRSSFRLQHDKYAFGIGRTYGVSIVDRNRRWCGRILYDESWEIDFDALYDFIVISEGVVRKENIFNRVYCEYEYVMREEMPDVYHYINVLLIDMVGKVAYRKALGRITIEAWKASQPVEVEIVLG